MLRLGNPNIKELKDDSLFNAETSNNMQKPDFTGALMMNLLQIQCQLTFMGFSMTSCTIIPDALGSRHHKPFFFFLNKERTGSERFLPKVRASLSGGADI